MNLQEKIFNYKLNNSNIIHTNATSSTNTQEKTKQFLFLFYCSIQEEEKDN